MYRMKCFKYLSLLTWVKILPKSKSKLVNILWIFIWTMVSVLLNMAIITIHVKNGCTYGIWSKSSLKLIMMNMVTITCGLYSIFVFTVIGYAGLKANIAEKENCWPQRSICFLISVFMYDGINIFNIIFYLDHPCDLGSPLQNSLHKVFVILYLMYNLFLDFIPVGVIGISVRYFTRWKDRFGKANFQKSQVM